MTDDEKTQIEKMTADARYNRQYGEQVIPDDAELNELLQNIERANESSDFTKDNLIDYLWAYMEASLVRLDELRKRDAALQSLAYQLRNLPSAYTRMQGPQGNGDRVANLLSDDAFAFGNRLKIVVETGEDPGDSRYTCWQIGCGKFKGHSGEHDIATPDDPHRNEPEGTGEA